MTFSFSSWKRGTKKPTTSHLQKNKHVQENCKWVARYFMVKLRNLWKSHLLFDSDIQCLSLSYTYMMTATLASILRVTLDLVNFEHDGCNKVRLERHLQSSWMFFSNLDIQTSLSPPVVLHVTLWLELGNPLVWLKLK